MGIRVCLKIQVLGFAADIVVVVAGVGEVASGGVVYVDDDECGVAVGGVVVINDDECGTDDECAADDECAVVVIYRSFR